MKTGEEKNEEMIKRVEGRGKRPYCNSLLGNYYHHGGLGLLQSSHTHYYLGAYYYYHEGRDLKKAKFH